MNKPENFILNSDYATYKNDSNATVTLVMPASQVIPNGGSYSAYSDVTVGTIGANMMVTIKHSGYPSNAEYSTQKLTYYADGSFIPMIVEVFRLNATTVRLRLFIPNNSGSSITTEATPRTITAKISTFLSPFV